MTQAKIATEIKYIRETLSGWHWTEFTLFIPFVTIALISLVIEYGFIFSSLWNWYISPITSFPNINIMQGIGLCFFIYAIKNNRNEEDINRTLKAFLMYFVPLCYLFIAWLFHCLLVLNR